MAESCKQPLVSMLYMYVLTLYAADVMRPHNMQEDKVLAACDMAQSSLSTFVT